MKYWIIAVLTLISIESNAQSLDKYWVQFKDKKGTPYSIFKPQEFLSPRAIERRQRLGIPVDEMDLPVSPVYLQTLEGKGAKIYTVSKWFNAATIYVEDESIIEEIKGLPFVNEVEATGRYRKPRPIRKKKSRDNEETYAAINNHYGYGWNQISMLNGHRLHQIGFRGEGMLVAVLDGGFVNFDISPFFDSVRAENRVLQSRDFVDNDDYAYEASNHGFNVVSTIVGNLPGLLVGTSPDATVVCIRTEEVSSELKIEEDNWVAGAEYADSLGVDVINSSLGYTSFDKSKMSYKYKDMNGKTARISIAADIAAKKGILVVNSAGNDGNNTWRYIGAPADANDILTVGAVTADKEMAYFSSYGPTYDGRIKPSVAARGYDAIVGTPTYRVDSASGTSFASPIMAGIVTSLWQAFPNKSNLEIIHAVEQSADMADNPNNSLGHGIPDMMKAFQLLSNTANDESIMMSKASPLLIANYEQGTYDVVFNVTDNTKAEVTIHNSFGQEVDRFTAAIRLDELNRVRLQSLTTASSGYYLVTLKTGRAIYRMKVFKM